MMLEVQNGIVQARNKAMMKVFSETQNRVLNRIKNDQGFYRQLLKKLIVQGLVKLMEREVVV